MKKMILCLVGALFLFNTPVALAQNKKDPKKDPKKEEPVKDPEAKKKALEMYGQAQKYYDTQEYAKALEIYKEIYLIYSSPAILFNIAQSYRNLKQYEEAEKAFRTYMRDMPEQTPVGSPTRAQVENLIKDMQKEQEEAAIEQKRQADLAAMAAASQKVIIENQRPTELSFGQKVKRYALSESLLVASAGFGTATLVLKFKVKSEGNVTDLSIKKTGAAVSVASDVALLASGVTFLITRGKLKKEHVVFMTPTSNGVTLALQGNF
jgi:hypothetical protein